MRVEEGRETVSMTGVDVFRALRRGARERVVQTGDST